MSIPAFNWVLLASGCSKGSFLSWPRFKIVYMLLLRSVCCDERAFPYSMFSMLLSCTSPVSATGKSVSLSLWRGEIVKFTFLVLFRFHLGLGWLIAGLSRSAIMVRSGSDCVTSISSWFEELSRDMPSAEFVLSYGLNILLLIKSLLLLLLFVRPLWSSFFSSGAPPDFLFLFYFILWNGCLIYQIWNYKN